MVCPRSALWRVHHCLHTLVFRLLDQVLAILDDQFVTGMVRYHDASPHNASKLCIRQDEFLNRNWYDCFLIAF